MHRSALCFAFICLALFGCAAPNPNLEVDPKTDRYPTSTRVHSDAILTYDTSVNPKRFSYVLLSASSEYRPTQIEFRVRVLLAQLGYLRVFNNEEMLELAKDRQLESGATFITGPAARRLSSAIGPILMINAGLRRNSFGLELIDATTGTKLLDIQWSTAILVSYDAEVILPVLNELRRWHREASSRPM